MFVNLKSFSSQGITVNCEDNVEAMVIETCTTTDAISCSHLPVYMSTPHFSNNTKQLEYLYLLERGGRQFVDDCLGLSSEHLLSCGVADGASSVGDDVVGVPHSGVHVSRTLSQCLGRDLLNLSVRRKG